MADFNRGDNRGGGGRSFGNRGGFGGGGRSSSFGPRRFGGGSSERREMHKAICAKCGKECEVPFRPSEDRPVYCNNCFDRNRETTDSRPPRRMDSDRPSDFGPRKMFETICDNCGNACSVPFRPTEGKPVYCSNCFEEKGERHERGTRNNVTSGPTNSQFDMLNSKLDKILSFLNPQVPQKAKKVEPVKVENVLDISDIEIDKPVVKKEKKKTVKKSEKTITVEIPAKTPSENS